MFNLVVEATRHPSPKFGANCKIGGCQNLQTSPITVGNVFVWEKDLVGKVIDREHEHEYITAGLEEDSE